MSRRPIINERVEKEWIDAQSYKNHREPVTIEVPLGSYLRFAAVAIPLIAAIIIIWPGA